MRNYKGIAYPIKKTTQGFFHCQNDVAQIKASFLTIIMTKPGERVCEPYFGTPLHQINIYQPKEITEEQCKAMIAKSLAMWEKRFPVTEITTKIVGSDLNITVSFIDPINLQQECELSLQMPLENKYE